MKWQELLREAVAMTRAAIVPSSLIAFLVAAMCVSTLLTVGRTAAAERHVAALVDAAGSRLLVVTDAQSSGLVSDAVIEQAAGLSVTETAAGLDIPVDATNASIGTGGTRVPTWKVVGDLATVVHLTAGRWPTPGEALVSEGAQRTLGMDHPVGAIEFSDSGLGASVVGSFVPREAFADLAHGIAVAGQPGESADSLHVVVRSHEDAGPAQNAILTLVAPPSPEAVTVRSPLTLAQLQADVSEGLGSFGRSLLAGVLGAGSLLTSIVVLADVLIHRADLGRRRALGATRGTVLALVVLRTLLAALVGTAVGSALGTTAASAMGAAPPWSFVVGTAVLALYAAALSSIPPAAYAAHRDPVRVLRTP